MHDIGVAGMAKPEAGVKGLMVWAGKSRRDGSKGKGRPKASLKGHRVGPGAKRGVKGRRQKKRATCLRGWPKFP